MMDPKLKTFVLKEIQAALEGHRPEIRRLIHETLGPAIHRMVREEIEQTGLTMDAGEPLPESLDIPDASGEALAPSIPGESGEGGVDGAYVYGVVGKGAEVAFGPMGIEGEEVYILWGESVGAVVHDGPARPYESSDEATVKRWLLAHQKVIEEAWDRCGVVIPTSFDTLIAAEAGGSPGEAVREWLDGGAEGFLKKLDAFTGKAEYGVQVFWDAPVMMQALARDNETIQSMKAGLQDKSQGAAYLHRQNLEAMMKKELEGKADQCFRDFYQGIRHCVTEVKVEKTKKGDDPARQMIMNLTCLMPREESGILGQELERIQGMPSFFVRFTGPWPPYSFA